MGRKLIDMTGRHIGYLTVIDYAGNEIWNCRCDCGNIVQRCGAQLRKASLSNCGCKTAEMSRRNGQSTKRDLTGSRIGNITVLEFIERKNGKEFFKCRCDCGEVIRVERRYLVEGSKTHCGCQNRKDMTGKKIGMLSVMSFAGIGKHGTALWNCRCDCGNEKVVDGALLRSGMSVSCGCIHRQVTSSLKKKYNDYEVDGNVVRVHLSNSDRIMICDLDDWERLKEYCWAFGKNGYATTNRIGGKPKYVAFHMNVLDCPTGLVRDHINRNKLDNRKSNLRAVSVSVNVRNTNIQKNNTTGYKGVTYSKRYKKYIAQIGVGEKTYFLGRFDTAQEAYAARLRGEEKYFGEVYSEVISE